MSTLVYSEPVSGLEMACQANMYRGTPDRMSNTTYSLANVVPANPSIDAGQAEDGGRLLSSSSDPSYALHTLVDMALALEESSIRRTDHTYALKNQLRKFPMEDTDNVSNEKDHTYASNTIGFRYSNHRSTQTQPRKSVSEESLLVKSSTESGTRKCTSAEEFAALDQFPLTSISSQHFFNTPGSNSATLPRSKNRMLPSSTRTLESSSNSFAVPTFSENFNAAGRVSDVTMDRPVKGDHTYAKFGSIVKCSDPSDPIRAIGLLSTSAPGKIECVSVETKTHIGSPDHTYDKLSSAKHKDMQTKFQAYRSSFMTPRDTENSEEENVNKTPDETEIHSNSLNPNIMDWQPQEQMHNFERRFLPMDHTYTAVS